MTERNRALTYGSWDLLVGDSLEVDPDYAAGGHRRLTEDLGLMADVGAVATAHDDQLTVDDVLAGEAC